LNRKISDKDKKDWQNFISKNENLPNKDSEVLENKIKKTKTFDLHGYSLDQANSEINKFIHQTYNQGVSKLIIVTGKGLHSDNEKNPYVSKNLGILKYSVPEYVKNNDELMKMINKIQDAKEDDGGSGAFYIFLKKKL
tara:strand:+ start:185 stop:598 length:414 start_codon:yes stop_codon:yes gene_type:complete